MQCREQHKASAALLTTSSDMTSYVAESPTVWT